MGTCGAESADLLLSQVGIGAAEILELEGLRACDDAAIYLSGSLAEGIGNDRSDVDVYVVGPREPSGDGFTLSKAGHSISLHIVERRRIDFEYWPTSTVERIAERLAGLRLGEAFVADALSAHDEIFAHRLAVGIPLNDPERWRALCGELNLESFRGYLEQQAIHRIDGALDDLAGMLDAGDLELAAHRARDLVGHAVDVHRHHCGSTNPMPKWRAKLLQGLPRTDRTDLVAAQYRELSFRALAADDPAAVAAYVEACSRFAHDVVGWAQG